MLEIHNFTQNEINGKLLERAAEFCLKEIGAKGEVEISLAIVGEGRIRKLNKIYRGKNRVTDVLSFDNKSVLPYLRRAFPRVKDSFKDGFAEAPDNIKRLGEIVICYPRAKKQAKAAGHSLEKELVILLTHGTLHLLGYDHEKNEKSAQEMKDLEKKIVKELSLN